MRKPGSARAVHPTAKPSRAGSQGLLLPRKRMWGIDRAQKRPRSSRSPGCAGKGFDSGEWWGDGTGVVTVLQQERKQARRALVHCPRDPHGSRPAWTTLMGQAPARHARATSLSGKAGRSRHIQTLRSFALCGDSKAQRQPWVGPVMSQPHSS